VHEVTIDRSFLAGLPDPSSEVVIGAVIDLGHRPSWPICWAGGRPHS
jgi:hypothetical protein